jgi:hypothetical protein
MRGKRKHGKAGISTTEKRESNSLRGAYFLGGVCCVQGKKGGSCQFQVRGRCSRFRRVTNRTDFWSAIKKNVL